MATRRHSDTADEYMRENYDGDMAAQWQGDMVLNIGRAMDRVREKTNRVTRYSNTVGQGEDDDVLVLFVEFFS